MPNCASALNCLDEGIQFLVHFVDTCSVHKICILWHEYIFGNIDIVDWNYNKYGVIFSYPGNIFDLLPFRVNISIMNAL